MTRALRYEPVFTEVASLLPQRHVAESAAASFFVAATFAANPD